MRSHSMQSSRPLFNSELNSSPSLSRTLRLELASCKTLRYYGLLFMPSASLKFSQTHLLCYRRPEIIPSKTSAKGIQFSESGKARENPTSSHGESYMNLRQRSYTWHHVEQCWFRVNTLSFCVHLCHYDAQSCSAAYPWRTQDGCWQSVEKAGVEGRCEEWDAATSCHGQLRKTGCLANKQTRCKFYWQNFSLGTFLPFLISHFKGETRTKEGVFEFGPNPMDPLFFCLSTPERVLSTAEPAIFPFLSSETYYSAVERPKTRFLFAFSSHHRLTCIPVHF